MSMIGCYRSLPESEIKSIENDDSHVENCLDNKKLPGLEIEKSWQAIHLALTGEAWGGSGPLFNAILGGREVGEDLGYGPARMLAPNDVKDTADALAKITPEDFAKLVPNCDFEGNQVYVYIDESPSDPETIKELTGYYTKLREFYSAAATNGHGMLLFLS